MCLCCIEASVYIRYPRLTMANKKREETKNKNAYLYVVHAQQHDDDCDGNDDGELCKPLAATRATYISTQ